MSDSRKKYVSGCFVNGVEHSPDTLGDGGESPTPQNISLNASSFSSGALSSTSGKAPTNLLTSQKVFQENVNSNLHNPEGVEGSSPHPPLKSVTPSPYYLDYTANLDLFDHEKTYPGALLLRKKVSLPCTPRFVVLQCGCGRSIMPSTCMSTACPNCAKQVSKRRALRAFEKLKYTIPEYYVRKSSRAVIYTIFTTPEYIRRKLTNPKTWQSLRSKAWKLLKSEFGGLYGVEASHPIGGEGEHFHPHLNFLWVQRRGMTPFIDVELLREKWALILGVAVADVHTEYASNHAQIMHWCKYALRTFPGYHHWTGPLRWYGKYPKMVKRKKEVCITCGQHYFIVGTIEASVVSDYDKRGFLMGLDPPWEDDNKITHFKKRLQIAG